MYGDDAKEQLDKLREGIDLYFVSSDFYVRVRSTASKRATENSDSENSDSTGYFVKKSSLAFLHLRELQLAEADDVCFAQVRCGWVLTACERDGAPRFFLLLGLGFRRFRRQLRVY